MYIGGNMNLLESTHAHKRHLTTTGYVVNKNRTKLLMIHHKKLNKWLPPGGHLEANEVPHEGAIREVLEETGVQSSAVVLDEPDLELEGVADIQIPRPYALLYQLIPKTNKDVEHIHLDMVYMLEADDTEVTNAQLDEVHAAKWHTKSEILNSDDVFDSAKGFARINLT
jgi:ADP-ribose pyrophosphatase YjhB (NUDIX family)